MSLAWDSTIPVHALFLGYSCPSSTSDFSSNGFVESLSSGSPRLPSTYARRRCWCFHPRFAKPKLRLIVRCGSGHRRIRQEEERSSGLLHRRAS